MRMADLTYLGFWYQRGNGVLVCFWGGFVNYEEKSSPIGKGIKNTNGYIMGVLVPKRGVLGRWCVLEVVS